MWKIDGHFEIWFALRKENTFLSLPLLIPLYAIQSKRLESHCLWPKRVTDPIEGRIVGSRLLLGFVFAKTKNTHSHAPATRFPNQNRTEELWCVEIRTRSLTKCLLPGCYFSILLLTSFMPSCCCFRCCCCCYCCCYPLLLLPMLSPIRHLWNN